MMNFVNVNFEDNEWKYIIIKYLKGWTEIPLCPTDGYDKEELKFYDGLLGVMIRKNEKLFYMNPKYVDLEFIDSWKFQGKIYRVLHHVCYEDKNGKHHRRLPKVKYHRMISHWTSDFTFNKLLYKLSEDEKYIILEADTGKHFGFDINKFRKVSKCEEPYTEEENEIIFSMYKECIKEYHMPIKEFVEMKKNSKK